MLNVKHIRNIETVAEKDEKSKMEKVNEGRRSEIKKIKLNEEKVTIKRPNEKNNTKKKENGKAQSENEQMNKNQMGRANGKE